MKFLPLFFALLLVACSSTPSDKEQKTKTVTTAASTTANGATASEPAEIREYIIQSGDVLEISVWKEQDLQKDVLVRPDGVLTFPLIGDITAGGLTIEQFDKTITDKLSRYIPRPSVTVSVKSVTGNKIYVVGKVTKPGEYIVNRNTDVMQMLSIAGGLTAFASENRIRILRRENGKQRVMRFKYSKVKKGKNLEQNIILQSGDVVVVP